MVYVNGLIWGWKQTGGDFEQRILIFKGQVVSSKFLAIFLGFLAVLVLVLWD